MLLDKEDRELLLIMQGFYWGLSLESSPCQASEVFRKFFKDDSFPYQIELATDLDTEYVEHFKTSCFVEDTENITIYKDGSVFLEHIEFYPEYWVADAEGWFDDDLAFSEAPEKDMDRLTHWNYGALVNNLCYAAWYKDLDSFFEENQPYCELPDFRWYALVAQEQAKYAPRYYASCCIRLLATIENTKSIDGYKFWLRAFYSRVPPSASPTSPSFDIYYPQKAKDRQTITILVIDPKTGIKEPIKWRHGQHGLFEYVAKNWNINSQDFYKDSLSLNC